MQQTQGANLQKRGARLWSLGEALAAPLVGGQALRVGRVRGAAYRRDSGTSSQIIWIVVHGSFT